MSVPSSGHGFGKSRWGSLQWGNGFVPPPGSPVITPLYPVDEDSDVAQSSPIFIRLTDNINIVQSTLKISVGPTIFVLGGVAQSGAVLFVTPNGGNGYDIELRLPDRFPLGSRQEVLVYVKDTSNFASQLIYHFNVGVGLRMLRVRNPSPNILLAYFNRALRLDESLIFVPNWTVDLISVGAAPLSITEVMANANHPDMATLRYVGGGSTYKLTVNDIADHDGNIIEDGFNSALFEILFGDEPAPTVRLFDTIHGPIGISQRVRTRRTMDDHVVGRSIALGMNEQFRLRFNNLDGSAGRDGRPGKNRT